MFFFGFRFHWFFVLRRFVDVFERHLLCLRSFWCHEACVLMFFLILLGRSLLFGCWSDRFLCYVFCVISRCFRDDFPWTISVSLYDFFFGEGGTHDFLLGNLPLQNNSQEWGGWGGVVVWWILQKKKRRVLRTPLCFFLEQSAQGNTPGRYNSCYLLT